MRLCDQKLLIKQLIAEYKLEDPASEVSWSIHDLAPVPLNVDAEARLRSMQAQEIISYGSVSIAAFPAALGSCWKKTEALDELACTRILLRRSSPIRAAITPFALPIGMGQNMTGSHQRR
ncbi:MAG: hypothetical protein IJ662_10730 [Clostridia bacterium]|nr:hypothetical protein [Clostridia bacterium]